MKNNVDIDSVIAELQKFYDETGSIRSLEYTFGFMDALRIVSEAKENNTNYLK